MVSNSEVIVNSIIRQHSCEDLRVKGESHQASLCFLKEEHTVKELIARE